jgi:copper transport protein
MRIPAILLVFLALSGEATAHAMLQSSSPADGAVLDGSPARIALRFNEPVVPVALRVVDAAGRTLHGPDGARTEGDAGVELDLPAPLANGRYVVSYRVVSADTHPVAGSIVFSVGTGTGDVQVDDGDPALDAFWAKTSKANRFVRDLLLAVGCGGLFFLVWLAPPGSRVARRAFTVAGALAAVATLTGVGISGARVALAPGLFDLSVWRIGAATSAGISALTILTGIALVLSGRRIATVAGLVAMAVGTALTGHAATGTPRWLVPGAQALHSLCAIVWIGAFVPLLLGCVRWTGDEVARVAGRFSPVGIACVAGIALSGMALAATRIHFPEALWSSEYGLLIAIKIAAFAMMLALAADNRFRALHASRGRFARNVALELALALVILSTTAILTHTPPSAHGEHAGHAVSERNGPSVALSRDGQVLFVEIDGTVLNVHFADAAGKAIDPMEVAVELSSPASGIAGLTRPARRMGPGHYRIDETSLSIPGVWQIGIGALVTDFRRELYATELVVVPRGR